PRAGRPCAVRGDRRADRARRVALLVGRAPGSLCERRAVGAGRTGRRARGMSPAKVDRLRRGAALALAAMLAGCVPSVDAGSQPAPQPPVQPDPAPPLAAPPAPPRPPV